MPGPIIPNPIPDWLQAQNASVTDSSLTKALRMIGHLIGADNPTTQVIGLMATDLPGEAPTGGLAKAVGDLWERAKTIRAFHGSPHDFEQFSTAKIGTGEGAQAYGHGLYFAENEGVAKGYKERLSAAYSNTPQETAQQALKLHGDRQVAAALLADRVKNLEQAQSLRQQATTLIDAPVFDRARYDLLTHQADSLEGGALATHPAEIEKLREASRILASGQPLEGRMYEVAIKAAPEDFLDWDKPLSQQSEKVKQALAAAGVQQRTTEEMDLLKYEYAKKFYEKPYFHLNDIEKQEVLRAVEANRIETGAAAYRKVGAATPADASAQLQQAGIPGIKYLDQGSRSAGEGSRNYVVFDDKLVDILKKYGIVLPAAGAASQMGPEKP